MENVASASIEKVGIRKWVKFKCWVNCPFKKFSLIAANDELKYHLVDGQDSLCVRVYMTRICGGSELTGSPSSGCLLIQTTSLSGRPPLSLVSFREVSL